TRVGAAVERDLQSTGVGSTLECRLRNPGDPWTPIVVLVPEPLAAAELQRLFELASPGRGVGVLAVGGADVGRDREVAIGIDGVTLSPPGLRLTPASFPDDMLSDVETLLASALSDEPGEELVPIGQVEPPEAAIAPDAGGVLVAIL